MMYKQKPYWDSTQRCEKTIKTLGRCKEAQRYKAEHARRDDDEREERGLPVRKAKPLKIRWWWDDTRQTMG